MCSECYTRSDQRINHWIDNDGPDECVALKNGILNLSELFKTADQPNETRILLPHTSNFFTTVCLRTNSNPAAKCPTWLNFLDRSFNSDAEQYRYSAEVVWPATDTDHAISKDAVRHWSATIGQGNDSANIDGDARSRDSGHPSINDLAGQWALHGLMDKTTAIISDARLSNKADGIAITEKMLSIIGEDRKRCIANTWNRCKVSSCKFASPYSRTCCHP